MGLIKKISEALKKTRDAIRKKLDYLLSGGELNDDFYEELTDILISCDINVQISMEIVDNLRDYAHKNKLRNAEQVRLALKKIMLEMLNEIETPEIEYPCIITIIGVNGVGKTTSIGKLAHFFKQKKKDVTLVAGDTFRAAASAQLTEWAERNKVRIIKHAEGADAAAVVYDGISSAKAKNTDVLLIDTAGRLHTKVNLMQELGKINKVIDKENNNYKRYNLIVLDATTGQNAVSQIKAFNEFINIDGIILTKIDGTAKGGSIITILKELNVPVVFVGTGESIDDIDLFSKAEFIENLF